MPEENSSTVYDPTELGPLRGYVRKKCALGHGPSVDGVTVAIPWEGQIIGISASSIGPEPQASSYITSLTWYECESLSDLERPVEHGGNSAHLSEDQWLFASNGLNSIL